VELKAGSGIVKVPTTDMAAATYQYSLVVNGKIVATKQMAWSR
jgi:hypothetical protein